MRNCAKRGKKMFAEKSARCALKLHAKREKLFAQIKVRAARYFFMLMLGSLQGGGRGGGSSAGRILEYFEHNGHFLALS